MTALFFYGTLCYRPLLELVLGGAEHLRLRSATLAGYSVFWADGQCFPVIEADLAGTAEGMLVEGLREADRARLDFYEGGFDYALNPVEVTTGDGPRAAQVFFPTPGLWPPGAPWSLDDWVRDWGAITLRAADEVMGYFGDRPASEVAKWFPMIRTRAASWVRAQDAATPVAVRRDLASGDVEGLSRRRPYMKFFMLEEQILRFRRFDGEMSGPVDRAAFVSGDAVTVLPYDPVRDRVLVIEQFRFAPYVRGDTRPWSLEAIAGRIDPGETPQDAARREAQEEAGLALQGMEPIAQYYPSPGAVTEYLYSYVALADLPDDAAGIGGEEAEAEDIRGILLSFADLMALLQSGEAENGPLILSALWLAAQRERLRNAAAG